MDTVTLYREIGRTLHEMGAFRVVLLNAKAVPGAEKEMYLEIAVDGCMDLENAKIRCRECWPEVEINLIDLNDERTMDLMDEVIEDGIQL